MGKYNSIAVIYGSDSSEWEISCRSGEFVSASLDLEEYDVYEIFARFGKWSLVAYRKKNSVRVVFPEGTGPTIQKNDFSVDIGLEHVKFDYAYVVQHGAPGENGLLQGYLQMLDVPFSSCDSFVCTIAFDKYACKSYVRRMDVVKCAPDVIITEGLDVEKGIAKVNETLVYPVFVKPTNGGSSFGITKVKDPSGLGEALEFAFKEGRNVLVEQGVVGKEITCAAYRDAEGVHALPLIEIRTDHEYFDYDAKYNGQSQEICPAPISDELTAMVQETTVGMYLHLGCSGIVRMDYILADDGLYFLEVNVIPGMTAASLVPKMVRTSGKDITSFLTSIIESS